MKKIILNYLKLNHMITNSVIVPEPKNYSNFHLVLNFSVDVGGEKFSSIAVFITSLYGGKNMSIILHNTIDIKNGQNWKFRSHLNRLSPQASCLLHKSN